MPAKSDDPKAYEVVRAFLAHPDVQAAFPQGAAEALKAFEKIAPKQ